MRIYVMSREALLGILRRLDEKGDYLDESTAIISISTPPGRPLQTSDPIELDERHTCHFLPLQYHDMDDTGGGKVIPGDGYTLFDEEMADQVVDFMEKAKQCNVLICHCDAGISRSAGTAAAISKYYTGEDQRFFNEYIPNKLVYRTILNAFYGREEK